MARGRESGFAPAGRRRAALTVLAALAGGVLLWGCTGPRVQTNVYQATQVALRQYSCLEIMNFTAPPTIAVPSAMLNELGAELAGHHRLRALFAVVTRGPAAPGAPPPIAAPTGVREETKKEKEDSITDEEEEKESAAAEKSGEPAAPPTTRPPAATGRVLRVEGQVVYYRLPRQGFYDRLRAGLEDAFYRTYSGDDTELIVRLRLRDPESGLELYQADVSAAIRDPRPSPVNLVVEEMAGFIESHY